MPALTITFGSLYQDEVEITRKNVTGVLAAATLFSLVCVQLLNFYFSETFLLCSIYYIVIKLIDRVICLINIC